MPHSIRGPLTAEEVLAQCPNDSIWVIVVSERSLPLLMPDPKFPGLQLLSLYLDPEGAATALGYLKVVKPDIVSDLMVQNAQLHPCVQLFLEQSRTPAKLRFMIHSRAAAPGT